MSSTYTSSNKFEKPATGEQSGSWGETVDNNYDLIDQALDGYAVINIPVNSTSISLSIANGQSSIGRARVLAFNAVSLSSSVTVQIVQNTVPHWWLVFNNTDQNLIFTGASGPTATVSPRSSTFIVSDGSTGTYDFMNTSGRNNFIGHVKAVYDVASPIYTGGSATLTGNVAAGSLDVASGITAQTITAASAITAPVVNATTLNVPNIVIGASLSAPNISTPGDVTCHTLTATGLGLGQTAAFGFPGLPGNTQVLVSGTALRGRIIIQNSTDAGSSVAGQPNAVIVTGSLPGTGPLPADVVFQISPANAAAASLYGPSQVVAITDPNNRKYTLMSGASPLQGRVGGFGFNPVYSWYYTVIL